ncbi:hypothetical protein SK128_016800, partial [Halocaridina rubra]
EVLMPLEQQAALMNDNNLLHEENQRLQQTVEMAENYLLHEILQLQPEFSQEQIRMLLQAIT